MNRTPTVQQLRNRLVLMLVVTLVAFILGGIFAVANAHAATTQRVEICHLEGAFNGHPGPTHYVDVVTTATAVRTRSHVTAYDIVPPFRFYDTGAYYPGQWAAMVFVPHMGLEPNAPYRFLLAGC